MSLSRDEIVARQAEHDALCRRQPGERDWKGNLVNGEDAPPAPAPAPAPAPEPEPEPEPEPLSDFESDFNN